MNQKHSSKRIYVFDSLQGAIGAANVWFEEFPDTLIMINHQEFLDLRIDHKGTGGSEDSRAFWTKTPIPAKALTFFDLSFDGKKWNSYKRKQNLIKYGTDKIYWADPDEPPAEVLQHQKFMQQQYSDLFKKAFTMQPAYKFIKLKKI